MLDVGMAQEVGERVRTDRSLAEVLVPVPVGTELDFGVVEMETREAVKTHRPADLSNDDICLFLGSVRHPRGEEVLGVHANTQSLVPASCVNNCRKLLEAAPDGSAGPGGVFDEDLRTRFTRADRCQVEGADECFGDAIDYGIHTRAEVTSDVQDNTLSSKSRRHRKVSDETLEGLLLQRIVAGREVDQVARVAVNALYGRVACGPLSEGFKDFVRRCGRFPLTRTQRKDLD